MRNVSSAWNAKFQNIRTNKIKMIGKLPDEVLEAVLEKMLVEFSVVDRNDKVLAWNKHNTRLFNKL